MTIHPDYANLPPHDAAVMLTALRNIAEDVAREADREWRDYRRLDGHAATTRDDKDRKRAAVRETEAKAHTAIAMQLLGALKVPVQRKCSHENGWQEAHDGR